MGLQNRSEKAKIALLSGIVSEQFVKKLTEFLVRLFFTWAGSLGQDHSSAQTARVGSRQQHLTAVLLDDGVDERQAHARPVAPLNAASIKAMTALERLLQSL